MRDVSETFQPFGEAMLTEAAPLALAWSRELCRQPNVSGRSCAPYHGFGQYLRLLGIANSLPGDEPFFRDALRPAIRRGARRVLVSGCADYAMAAVVLWIFAGEGVRPELTVLDVCETPLRLSQWYARRHGTEIDIVVSDILDYRPAERFDIICTHLLLGFISPEQRSALAARWHELLAPGGVVATVNRVRPEGPALVRFDAAQARAFADRVSREATARQDLLGNAIRPDELAALADGYSAYNVLHAVRSEADSVALLTGAGLAIDILQTRTIDRSSSLHGPSLSEGGATYQQVVAVRR